MSRLDDWSEQLAPDMSQTDARRHDQQPTPPSPPPPPGTRTRKLYQVWPAHSHALCRGRLVIGVHLLTLLMNAAITVVGTACFCIWVAWPLHWALIVPAIVIAVATEMVLVFASFMDPGIVPRQAKDERESRMREAFEHERDAVVNEETRRHMGLAPVSSYTYPAQQPVAQPVAPISHTIHIDGTGALSQQPAPVPLSAESASLSQQYSVPVQRVHYRNMQTGEMEFNDVPLKWCSTCNIYRPHNASHCRDCDQCVTEFDHHCPWISNCVGERNHRAFVGFVFSLTALIVYVFVVCLYSLIKAGVNGQFDNDWSDNIAALVLVIFTFIVGWCMLSLSGYHCYLIAERTTTNQHIKQQRMRRAGQGPQPLYNNSQQQQPQSAVTGSASDRFVVYGHSWPKRQLYEPVIAAKEHAGFVGAFYEFFCSPLPQRRVNMDGECVVDHDGKVLSYPPPLSRDGSSPQ